MDIIIKGYRQEDAILSDYEEYTLFIEGKGGEKTDVTVFCSSPLQEVWGLNTDSLFQCLYQTVRKDIERLIQTGKVKNITGFYPLTYSTYNAPAQPPEPDHLFPDTIKVEDPLLFKSPEEHHEKKAKPIERQTEHQISFLGESIAELRDTINSITKVRWGFRLFEIEKERAIVSMYASCQNKEEFTNRISALTNLVTWINKDAINGMLTEKIHESKGTSEHLEKFIDQEFNVADAENTFGKFEDLQITLKEYMTQSGSAEVVERFKELGIPLPQDDDYSLTWEGVLFKYFSFLNFLLQNMESK